MSKKGKKCLVIEKRNHIGGNIYTEKKEGINVHKYGAHIFHTDYKDVWEYVNSFIEFNNYDCKYSDCMHIKEDGCYIKQLVENNQTSNIVTATLATGVYNILDEAPKQEEKKEDINKEETKKPEQDNKAGLWIGLVVLSLIAVAIPIAIYKKED